MKFLLTQKGVDRLFKMKLSLYFVLKLLFNIYVNLPSGEATEVDASNHDKYEWVHAERFSDVNLNCNMQVFENCRWMYNNFTLTFAEDFIRIYPPGKVKVLPYYSLLIRNVDFEDEGVYRCICANTVKKTFHLKVKVRPRQVSVFVNGATSRTKFFVKSNVSVSISCRAYGAIPPVQLHWKSNGVELNGTTTIFPSSFVFDTLSTLDYRLQTNGDNLSCTASHEFEDYDPVILSLHVKSKPHLMVTVNDTDIQEPFTAVIGMKYNLTCITYSAQSHATLLWILNNATQDENVGFTLKMASKVSWQEGYTLGKSFTYQPNGYSDTISCRRPEDSEMLGNTYTITTQNIQIPTVYLQVNGQNVTEDSILVFGTIYNITCLAKNARPPVNFQWTINDIRLHFNKTEIIREKPELHIFTSVSNFACHSQREVDEVSCQSVGVHRAQDKLVRTRVITVVSPKLFIESKVKYPSSVLAFEPGEEINLTCVARGARPPVNVTWIIGNSSLPATFSIVQVTPSTTVTMNTYDSTVNLTYVPTEDIENLTCASIGVYYQQNMSTMIVLEKQVTVPEQLEEKPTIPTAEIKVNGVNITTNFVAVFGNIHNLTCIVHGISYPVKAQWRVNDVIPDLHVRSEVFEEQGRSQKFTSVSNFAYYPEKEVDEIVCQVVIKNTTHEIMTKSTAFVVVCPKLFIESKGKHLSSVLAFETGEEINLTCVARGARPPVNVTWIIGNKSLPVTISSVQVTRSTTMNTYDSSVNLTYMPKEGIENLTCASIGVYYQQNMSTMIVFEKQAFESAKKSKSSSIAVYPCVSLLVGISMMSYFVYINKSRLLGIIREKTASLNFQQTTEVTEEKATSVSEQRTYPQRHKLPEIPLIEETPLEHLKTSEEVEEEDQYACITNNVAVEYAKVYTKDDITFVLPKKNGSLIVRWLGVITANGKDKCVFISAKTENSLHGEGLSWSVYVKKLLELKESLFFPMVEGVCLDSANLYLLQEHLPAITMDKYMEKKKCEGITYSTRYFPLVWNILLAIEFLHSFWFLHPGLSPKKVLIGEDGKCKLYDFYIKEDASKKVTSMKSQNACNLNHLPPESLSRNEYVQESDVWSFAILMWSTLFEGTLPFSDTSDFFTLQQEDLPQKPEKLSSCMYSCFTDVWQLDPTARPTLNEIKESVMKISMEQKQKLDGEISIICENYISMTGSRSNTYDTNTTNV